MKFQATKKATPTRWKTVFDAVWSDNQASKSQWRRGVEEGCTASAKLSSWVNGNIKIQKVKICSRSMTMDRISWDGDSATVDFSQSQICTRQRWTPGVSQEFLLLPCVWSLASKHACNSILANCQVLTTCSWGFVWAITTFTIQIANLGDPLLLHFGHTHEYTSFRTVTPAT